MSPNHPCISIIMSVYNAGKFVDDCIRSILEQTFPDFEFIIINDASTDSSPEIIKSYKDGRIRLLNNHKRSYPTRNKGLKVARGKYICIMGADDISLPHWFERQVLFMEQNPEFGLAGSGYRVLGKDKDLYRENDYEKINVHLMRNNCVIHPSVIIRHDLLKKFNLRYIRKYYYSADYDFIARAARYFPITNIPEVLMHYRVHEEQVTMQYRTKQAEYADEIALEQLRYLGIDPGEDEARLHISFLKGVRLEYSQKHKLYEWLDKVKNANNKIGFYREDELEAFFNALLSLQPFCREAEKILPKGEEDEKKDRMDLSDVTFVIPLRIDSQQRIENINTLVKYITSHFYTNVYILETDSKQRYFPDITQDNVYYSKPTVHQQIINLKSLCKEKSTGIKEVPSQYPINNILNPRINLPVTWSHTLDTFSIHRPVLARRVSSKTIHLTEPVFSPYSSTVFRNFVANNHNTSRQHIDGLFFRR